MFVDCKTTQPGSRLWACCAENLENTASCIVACLGKVSLRALAIVFEICREAKVRIFEFLRKSPTIGSVHDCSESRAKEHLQVTHWHRELYQNKSVRLPALSPSREHHALVAPPQVRCQPASTRGENNISGTMGSAIKAELRREIQKEQHLERLDPGVSSLKLIFKHLDLPSHEFRGVQLKTSERVLFADVVRIQ